MPGGGRGHRFPQVEFLRKEYFTDTRGIEQGIERGKRNMLLQLLRKKFGELPSEFEMAVGKIDAAELLDQLSLAVLDVQSLGDFIKLLPNTSE